MMEVSRPPEYPRTTLSGMWLVPLVRPLGEPAPEAPAPSRGGSGKMVRSGAPSPAHNYAGILHEIQVLGGGGGASMPGGRTRRLLRPRVGCCPLLPAGCRLAPTPGA